MRRCLGLHALQATNEVIQQRNGVDNHGLNAVHRRRWLCVGGCGGGAGARVPVARQVPQAMGAKQARGHGGRGVSMGPSVPHQQQLHHGGPKAHGAASTKLQVVNGNDVRERHLLPLHVLHAHRRLHVHHPLIATGRGRAAEPTPGRGVLNMVRVITVSVQRHAVFALQANAAPQTLVGPGEPTASQHVQQHAGVGPGQVQVRGHAHTQGPTLTVTGHGGHVPAIQGGAVIVQRAAPTRAIDHDFHLVAVVHVIVINGVVVEPQAGAVPHLDAGGAPVAVMGPGASKQGGKQGVVVLTTPVCATSGGTSIGGQGSSPRSRTRTGHGALPLPHPLPTAGTRVVDVAASPSGGGTQAAVGALAKHKATAPIPVPVTVHGVILITDVTDVTGVAGVKVVSVVVRAILAVVLIDLLNRDFQGSAAGEAPVPAPRLRILIVAFTLPLHAPVQGIVYQ